MRSRRTVIGAVALCALLAACAGDDDVGSAGDSTELVAEAPSPDGDETPDTAPPTTSPDASTTTTKPTTTPATGSIAPSTDGPDAAERGPGRIVVGNHLLLDPALALGLPVVGVAAPSDRAGIPPYLADLASSVEPVVATPEPNYEQLLALSPDLIIVPEEAADIGVLDRLEAIARTETTPGNTATPWPEVLRELAALTGRLAEAETLIAEWEVRATDFRTSVGDALDLEVSLVRCFRDSCRYLPGATSFAGFVLDQLGVARPEIQRADPEGRPFVEVSLEQIDLLDGDVIVLFGSDGDEAIGTLEANPLWAQLRAVQDGRVHRADPFAWFQGNVIAAEVIADDLEAWLTGS